MKKDLEDKVTKTNLILALDYLTENKVENAKGAIKNIYISKYDAIPSKNVFKEYLKTQKNWRSLLNFARDQFYELRQIFTQSQLCPEESNNKEVLKDPTEIKNLKLKELEIFQKLNYEEKKSLMKISETKTFEPDDLVIKHGEPDNTLYIILSGRAKITEYNENKNENQEEVVLAEMKSGDFFGLTSLISKTNNIYRGDVKAIEPLVLISFPRQKIINFFHKYHKSSVDLLLYFIEKLNDHLNIVAELYTESQIKSQDIQSAINEDPEA